MSPPAPGAAVVVTVPAVWPACRPRRATAGCNAHDVCEVHLGDGPRLDRGQVVVAGQVVRVAAVGRDGQQVGLYEFDLLKAELHTADRGVRAR